MRVTNRFMFNNRFVYDKFMDIVVFEKDMDVENPKRYFKVSPSKSGDLYTDVYWTDKDYNTTVEFTYSHHISPTVNSHWNDLLQAHLLTMSIPISNCTLKERIYPKKYFRELIKKEFGGNIKNARKKKVD